MKKNIKKPKRCAYCGHLKSEHKGKGVCNHKSHRNLLNTDYYCRCSEYVEEVFK